MALLKCPECGNQVSEMADKCLHCGFPIHMKVNRSKEKRKCSYCGTINAIYEDVCSSCGARFEEATTEEKIDMDTMNATLQVESQDKKGSETTIQEDVDLPKLKNKWIGLLLCFFLGIFGAHKFYEGKFKMEMCKFCITLIRCSMFSPNSQSVCGKMYTVKMCANTSIEMH